MQERPVPRDQIKGLECKHAFYCKAQDGSKEDLLVVKENIHTTDERIIPNLNFVYNYKRTFYITKEGFRNHESKKEWEDIDKLQKFTTTEVNLKENIARALGKPGMRGSLRMMARNPYIYGADITTPTLIKKQYQNRFPNAISKNSVAVIDIETDVVEGHERPIYVGITYRDKAYLASTQEFLGDIPTPEEMLHKKFWELLGEHAKKRQIKLEVEICRDAGEAVANAIAKAHEWEPDFLSAWNIDFDIPRMARTLEDFGYYLPDVFSDPRVPRKFRFYKYKQGPSQKTTASGQVVPIHPAERWHVAEAPATFYMIDSMCLYKRIRMAEQNENSYSLDYQLQKQLGQRKLKFDDIVESRPGTLDWHIEMQKFHKIEYGVYNLFDCIGVELFDEKVQDLAQTITVQSGVSEYGIFKSQPKRLVDQLYFFCLERGKVVATCSDDMVEDLDDHVVGMNGWVITLPSHLRYNTGLKVIKELPDIRSEAHAHVADLDVASGYPNIQRILNMSKETTYRELSKIRGVDPQVQRMNGINLTASHVNAYEFGMVMFKAPKFDELLESFQKQ